MEVVINNKKYKVIKDNGECLDVSDLNDKITEYYDSFDYILGDFAYGKVRLKGFNEKENKYYKPINDYKNIDEYLEQYCAYGCKYFILKKL